MVMLLQMDLRLVMSLDTSNPLKLLRSNLSVLQQTGKVSREWEMLAIYPAMTDTNAGKYNISKQRKKNYPKYQKRL